MKKLVVLICAFLALSDASAFADGPIFPPLRVREQDGAPDVIPVFDIKVSNGTMTDDGAGAIQLTTGGGSSTAAGNNTEIQYNSGGSFAGNKNLVWVNADKRLIVSGESAQIRITSTLSTEGVNLSSESKGILDIGGVGGTNNERFLFNMEITADVVNVSSDTGVNKFAFNGMSIDIGGPQSRVTGRNDVYVDLSVADRFTIGMTGGTNNESIAADLDNTADVVGLSSTTSVQTIDTQTIGLDLKDASIRLPASLAPTVDSLGKAAVDTNVISSTMGALQVYDGTQLQNLVGTTDAPANTEVPQYASGTGKVTWSVIQTSDITGTYGSNAGGTGLTTYSKGQLLVGNSASGLSPLTVGADGTILTADASAALGVKWIAAPSGGGAGDMILASAQTNTGVKTFNSGTLKFPDIANIIDGNANEILSFDAVGSAVNYAVIASAATGTNPVLSADGTDANVGLGLNTKGTGGVVITSSPTATVSTLTAGIVVNNGQGAGTAGRFQVLSGDGVSKLISADPAAGGFSTDGKFVSYNVNDIGWSIVDQSDNQACNTGCRNACVAGQDLAGANKPLVGCTDTTADICLCAGAA